MKIKIMRCSDKSLWYYKHVGEIVTVKYYDSKCKEYVVQTPDGTSNIVKPHDAQETGYE